MTDRTNEASDQDKKMRDTKITFEKSNPYTILIPERYGNEKNT